MGKEDFNIVIMHGRADHYKTVRKYVRAIGYSPLVLKDNYNGKILLTKVQKVVWDEAHSAVIVMSPDDWVHENEYRARQNVVFELGYCMAAFYSIPKKYWYNAVIILKEKKVNIFSDIYGLEVIEYVNSPSQRVLATLGKALNHSFQKARKYYKELKE